MCENSPFDRMLLPYLRVVLPDRTQRSLTRRRCSWYGEEEDY